MNKKVLIIGQIVMLAIVLIGLTGCGSSSKKSKKDTRFNYVIDELNTAVDEVCERNDDKQISVVRIEGRLEQALSSAKIIACGDKAFTKKVDLTQTTYTTDLDGYDGTILSSMTSITKDSNVNYCLVFDSKSRGYLNIKVKYEKIDDENYKTVFSAPELLN